MLAAERTGNITVIEALRRAERYLLRHGVEGARLSAEHILAKRLGCSRLDLYLRFDQAVADGVLQPLRDDLAKRAAHYPLQYILGDVEFLGLRFRIREGVFIPRPETELLVEWIEELIGGSPAITFVEFGVGSGVIAASIAARHAGWRGTAVDRSPGAVALARENAEALGVAERLAISRADDLDDVGPAGGFDVLVSNPPYIPRDAIAELEEEVSRYEDRTAIDGGPDGLRFYPALGEAGLRLVCPGGLVAFEIGHGQAGAVEGMLEGLGYEAISMRRDYHRFERMITALVPRREGHRDG
jgi:release factor glutamine methyltransferase